MGFYLIAGAYLQHHPKPRAVFLCMCPFAFHVGAFQTGGRLTTRFLANYGPEVPGVIPLYKCVDFYAKRGTTDTWRRIQLSFGCHLDDPREVIMFGKTGETYRDLQRHLIQARGYSVPPGLRGPGWSVPQGWPDQPVKVNEEWDESVRKLALLCEEYNVPLYFRLTPVRKDYKDAKDYSRLVKWMNDLRDYHHMIVVDPILDFWDLDWHWDAIHLNGPGAKRYTASLCQDMAKGQAVSTPVR